MRKVYFFAAVLTMIFSSCSKDDDSGNSNFSVTIQQNCPGLGTPQEHCVSEETKNDVLDLKNEGGNCVWVSFTDAGGNNRSGYFRSAGTAGEGICN